MDNKPTYRLVYLSQEEFNRLPKYSISIPTLALNSKNNIVGCKRWKHNLWWHNGDKKPVWLLGEWIPKKGKFWTQYKCIVIQDE